MLAGFNYGGPALNLPDALLGKYLDGVQIRYYQEGEAALTSIANPAMISLLLGTTVAASFKNQDLVVFPEPKKLGASELIGGLAILLPEPVAGAVDVSFWIYLDWFYSENFNYHIPAIN